MEIVESKNKIPIRLTDERWSHITEEHCELAGRKLEVLEAIAKPEKIISGNHEALMATRAIEPGKHLIVVYRESEEDGFIITAFLTRKLKSLEKRKQLWP